MCAGVAGHRGNLTLAELSDTVASFPPQVSIRLDGENKAVEYNAVGLTKDAVRAVFKNPEVDNLFDRNWHKIGLSVEAKSVSLFLDCKHIQTLPIEEREDIDIQGKTVIGKRLYDSVPIDVSPLQRYQIINIKPKLWYILRTSARSLTV